MRNRIVSFTALLMALLMICVSLPGCSGGETGSGADEAATGATMASADVENGLVRLALSSPIDTMDVHKNTEDYMLPLNIYERLFDIRVNEDGTTRLANGLVENHRCWLQMWLLHLHACWPCRTVNRPTSRI